MAVTLLQQDPAKPFALTSHSFDVVREEHCGLNITTQRTQRLNEARKLTPSAVEENRREKQPQL